MPPSKFVSKVKKNFLVRPLWIAHLGLTYGSPSRRPVFLLCGDQSHTHPPGSPPGVPLRPPHPLPVYLPRPPPACEPPAMPIAGTDVKFKLSTTSGSTGNTLAQADPNLSLGKYVSTTQITDATTNNLFDDITGDENAAGAVDYRCFFVHNSHATLTLLSPKVWISAEVSGGGFGTDWHRHDGGVRPRECVRPGVDGRQRIDRPVRRVLLGPDHQIGRLVPREPPGGTGPGDLGQAFGRQHRRQGQRRRDDFGGGRHLGITFKT